MTSPETPSSLQFDRAEPATPSSGPACVACSRPLTDTYHTLNDRVLCEPCRRRLESEWTSASGAARVLPAFLWGLGGAILGAALYYGVLALTGYEIGLIALVVGWLVGRGVRQGSGGRGGALYQAMAIVLTYASIVSTYVPMLAQDPEAAATSPLVLFLMAATIPFLTPFVATGQGLIGLLILAFALYEAWRQNRRPLMAFAGPFQVKATAS
jgi:hypothetical protein